MWMLFFVSLSLRFNNNCYCHNCCNKGGNYVGVEEVERVVLRHEGGIGTVGSMRCRMAMLRPST